MMYLFVGMLIGGIWGLAIGGLGTAVRFLKADNFRLKKETKYERR